jgi:hypothetical protein
MDGRTPSMLRRGELACHCLLVELDRSWVTVERTRGFRIDRARARSREHGREAD